MPISSHESPKMVSDVWLTPPEIVQALGSFDLDPCSPVPRPWDTAQQHYALPQDGLELPWFGRIWLNPPYGRNVGLWMNKLSQHGVGTALVFARTETKFFFDYIWKQASALLFLDSRLRFYKPDGIRYKTNAGAPSVLVAYGDKDTEKLVESGISGAFVPLANGNQVVIAFSVKWMELVISLFKNHGGEMKLQDLYVLLSDHPKAKSNPNWKAKLRQIVQRDSFIRVSPSIYRVKGE